MLARYVSLLPALLCVLGCAAPTTPKAAVPKSPRLQVLAARTPEEKAEAYRELFRSEGPARLKLLLKDEDTGIALQAAWEVHTKAVRRQLPATHRSDWVYDRAGLERFVAFLKDRTGASVPDWWHQKILDVDLEPGEYHAFIKRPAPKVVEVKGVGYVPEGV